MQPKNDGGPFHPCECQSLGDGRIDGLAMQALLSPNHPWGGYPEKGIPRVAWEMADAMLAERERGR